MKKVLFLLVSLLMTGTAYASNLSKNFVAMVSDNGISVNEQGQALILEQPMSDKVRASGHQSHRSHSSHRSHYSSRMN